MTPAEAKSVNLRPGAFAFTVDGAAFAPPAGAVLRLASMAVDTLTLTGLPVGLVSRGSVVTASYNGVKVFQGTPASRVERWGRGTTHFEDVTFEGPWGNLARYVFRQSWGYVAARGGSAVTMQESTARVVLNVRPDGTPQDMTEQIREIAEFAAAKCGYAYAAAKIDAGGQVLPADEAHDITCAAAIVRTLRFFPKTVARFDYSGASPSLRVFTPSAQDAGWVSGAKVISRAATRKDHPVVGVQITTSPARTRIEVGDEEFDSRQFETQSAGDTESLDCLHLYMPLSGGSGSTEYETLDCVGHVKDFWDVTQVKGRAFFWKQYHPRLQDVPLGAITIDAASVRTVDPVDPATEVTPFRYVTDLTVGDLRHFGQNAVACRFCCKARIVTEDEDEEDVFLTMDFVTTDAVQRTYTQMSGMSSEEGETLPEGLAAAILAQRAGELECEDLVIRLPGALPEIGDAKSGLLLQSMTVDCNELTADCHFGHPNYLSAEEMRDLLTGFRGRAFSSSAICREDPDPSGDSPEETSGIQPISSTEFSPGTKRKTTVKSRDGGSIVLDPSRLGGETAKMRTVTLYDKDGRPSSLKVLSTEERPGEGEEEDETEEDPHDTEDPHGDDTDACNPGGGSDSPDGSGGGGGAGAAAAADDGVVPSHGTEGGAGVDAGENPGTGSSSPGCDC